MAETESKFRFDSKAHAPPLQRTTSQKQKEKEKPIHLQDVCHLILYYLEIAAFHCEH